MPLIPRITGARPRNRPVLSATVLVGLALAFAAPGASAADLSEDFDPTTTPGTMTTPAGWTQDNRSNPVGLTSWFQGNNVVSGGPFDAHQGAPSAYLGANFNSTTGGTGTISTWLYTPQFSTLTNGDRVSFYTRSAAAQYPDRLELRVSTNGSCAPGPGATNVGSFTTLLVSVNPSLVVGGYPGTWTQYSVVLSGLPDGANTGCLAFRYFVTGAGPLGTSSDYIGIDTFRFVEDVDPPIPPTITNVAPTSPGSDNAPRATGDAEAGSTVRIYGDSTCTGPVLGTGPAADFNGGAGVAFTVADNATVTPRATATDGSGNVSGCSAAGPTYVEDSISPVTTDDVPTGWLAAAPAITLSATDLHAVTATYYEIGTSPAVPTTASTEYDPAHKPTLADGQRIRYFSVDEAGNAEDPITSAAAKVDTTAPTTTDDVPTDWVAAPPTVTLDATDTQSGVTHTYYEIGANPAVPTTASTEYDPAHKPTLTHGQRIRAFSVDAVGNAEAPVTSAAAKVDTTAPTTTDDVTASATPGAPVTLTATDAASGVAATYFTTGIDPAPPTTASSVYDPASRPVLAAGERIRYFSVDAVGHAEEPHSSLAVPAPAPPAPQPGPQPQPGPAPAPQPVPAPGPAPKLVTELSGNARCLGTIRGAKDEITVRYTTAAAAKVTFSLQRRTAPRATVPTHCPAALPAGNGITTKDGTAVVYATVTTTSRATVRAASRAVRGRKLVVTRNDTAGRHTLALLRTFKVKRLAPGRYRLLVEPSAGGTAGRPASIYLWVLAARR